MGLLTNSWTVYIVALGFTVCVMGAFIWKQKKKNFIKVGKISNLFFFPVKSLKAVEVTKGKLTSFGFEVNGLLDRSFMLIHEENVLLSQRQHPTLVLLTSEVIDNYLVISAPNLEPLKVEILKSPPSNAKIINCKIHTDVVDGVDCGEKAATWFQKYLSKNDIRLVRFFPSITLRKYLKKNQFLKKMREDYPFGFHDEAPCHVLSQASIDDLNSRMGEKKVSVLNFRPNVLIDGCAPYDEDSWEYMKFGSDAILKLLFLITRCLLTTNDPDTGVLSQKEPLVSLRKYRIPSDAALIKILGSLPCLGTGCAVLSPGNIKVGDDVFAVVQPKPKMQEKS